MVISNISIHRPVFAVMVLVALMVFGLYSFGGIPVDTFPDVEWGYIEVGTVYPGASPETVERSVTRPIEEALNTIQDVRNLYSTSRPGYSSVSIELDLNADIDARVQDVRDKVALVRGRLPDDVDEPTVRTFGESDNAIISLALASESLDRVELTSYAEEIVQRRLESVDGVGNVLVYGGQSREIRLTVDPARLAAYNLGVDEVVAAVRASNMEVGAGTLEGATIERDLTITGRLKRPEDFGFLVVGQAGGAPVLLSQVADIDDTGTRADSAAFLDGRSTVSLDILKVKDSNTVEVAEGVMAELGILKEEFPAATTVEVVQDGAELIRESLAEVKETLSLASLLTIFVVFLFLGSWRSTVITGLTLPIAIVSSFMVFKAAGLTLNILSTMGLVISIGILIDDAIVVRENIVRHLAMGKSPIQAAKEGTAEIGLAVTATTFSLVAVFVPIAFMGGIVGQYFFDFAIVVAFAVLVSLLVSFTLDPMLSSIWHDPAMAREIAQIQGLPVPRRRGPGVLLDYFHDFLTFLAKRYSRAIHWSVKHPWAIHGIAIVVFVAAMLLISKVGVGFVPDIDESQFNVTIEAPESATLAYTTAKTHEVEEALAIIPEVKYLYSTVGGGSEGPHVANVLVKVVDVKERDRTLWELMPAARTALQGIAGVKCSIATPGGGGGGSAVAVSLVGNNIEDLRTASREVTEILDEMEGVVNVRSSEKVARRSVDVEIDRQVAALYNVSVGQVAGALRAFAGEDEISTWEDENGEEHSVVVALPEEWRADPSLVEHLQVTGLVEGQRVLVPVAQLAEFLPSLSASQIDRRNLKRVITVSADVEGRDVGGANTEFQSMLKGVQLPGSIQTVDSGEGQQIAETAGYAGVALLLAIIFIYLILASQFNSLLQPFAIMASMPLALIGVVLGLWAFGSTLNIMSMIGVIMLMGLVTKNAILLVEFANQLRERGLDRAEALAQAGETRLRPILMTTAATLAGMSPLAFVLGSASQFRAPLAQAVMGGVLTSTLLTLFVVPVAYIFWDSIGAWFHRKFHMPSKEDLERAVVMPPRVDLPPAE